MSCGISGSGAFSIAAKYYEMAARMRTLAKGMPGFISLKTFNAEDGERVSVIEFKPEETLRAWREHPEHRMAQELGRTFYYTKFQIQVCSIIRQYGFSCLNARPEAAAERR
jgi:heme-degrading monooxygenase HmoA